MKKILLNIPEQMLSDIDNFCKEFGLSRIEMIRSAIRNILYAQKMPQERILHANRIVENINSENAKAETSIGLDTYKIGVPKNIRAGSPKKIPGEFSTKPTTSEIQKSVETPQESPKIPTKILQKMEGFTSCKHGAKIGLCKHGCK